MGGVGGQVEALRPYMETLVLPLAIIILVVCTYLWFTEDKKIC